MVELDKTENKGSLGANATLVVSIATCKAGAAEKDLLFYNLGVPTEALDGILQAFSVSSLEAMEELLGVENEAIVELKQLFVLADSYGFEDWLQFDASVVRGLAYYTRTVFELLKDRGLMPHLSQDVDYIVLPMEEKLCPQAVRVTTKRCAIGHSVDLVMENKKMKWAFKHAESLQAERLVLVRSTEWEKGTVQIKDLGSREESDDFSHCLST